MDMGVYARVLSAGTLSVDEEILLTG
jgi:MOSC domain-containing protein YiiM